jgi:FkbM family methyltransferase
MNIFEVKKAYNDGKLLKQDFIDAMCKNHLVLNDYAEYMKNTEIKRITIENGKVYMTSDEGIVIRCNFIDKAGIPLVNLSFGSYEREERLCVMKLIESNDVVFDIGVNYGWYSLNIAKKYPNVRIYAFEPIKYTFDIFSENIEINNIKNINIFNVGIGKENTVTEFNFNRDHSGATSMVNLLERENVEKIKCSIRTLDSFVKQEKIDRVDFIKCDVEGAEFFALQGGKNVLELYRPKLFVEMLRKWSAKFGYHPNDIIHFMNNLGYCCFEISNGKLCPFDNMTDETISTNFIFLHREKHSSIIEPIPPPPTKICKMYLLSTQPFHKRGRIDNK